MGVDGDAEDFVESHPVFLPQCIGDEALGGVDESAVEQGKETDKPADEVVDAVIDDAQCLEHDAAGVQGNSQHHEHAQIEHEGVSGDFFVVRGHVERFGGARGSPTASFDCGIRAPGL